MRHGSWRGGVLPMSVWHTASVGLDLWLTAVAQGAAHVALLASGEEAPQYVEALEAQMQVAQAILEAAVTVNS